MMREKIKSYEVKIFNTYTRIQNRLINEADKLKIESGVDSLMLLTPLVAQQILSQYELDIADTLKEEKIGSMIRVKRRLKNLKRGVESDFSLVTSYRNSINLI